jgi:hypothetical protein
MDEMYCAVHNADCPLHGHNGDPWVLHVNPGSIPSGWMCPQAVKEIENFGIDAESKIEENDIEVAGLNLKEYHERIVHRAVQLEDYDKINECISRGGAEAMSVPMIDGARHAVETHQEQLSEEYDLDEVEKAHSILEDFWDDNV